jgi:hypothetical protein
MGECSPHVRWKQCDIQRIDNVYKQNSHNPFRERSKVILCPLKSPEMAPATWLRFQRIGDHQTPRSLGPRRSSRSLCQGACCPDPGCDTMEPHRVDSVCLVGKLRSAPVMAARFERSSVLKCPPAKAVSRQALPVPLSDTHKPEDLEN